MAYAARAQTSEGIKVFTGVILVLQLEQSWLQGYIQGTPAKDVFPSPRGKNFVSRVPKSQLIVSRRTCECMVLRGFLGQRQFSMRHPSLRSAAVCKSGLR